MNVFLEYQIDINIKMEGISQNNFNSLPSTPAEFRTLDKLRSFKYQLGDEAKRLFRKNPSKLNFEIDTSNSYVSINSDLHHLEYVKVKIFEQRKSKKLKLKNK